MFYSTKPGKNTGIIFSILCTAFLASCSSDDGSENSNVQINIEGIWSAYWNAEVATVDHLIIDEDTGSGNIKGRWYDAEDDVYYIATGTIDDHDVDINVQYPFSWDLKATLNAGNDTISAEVTISGTGSSFDDAHELRLEKVN